MRSLLVIFALLALPALARADDDTEAQAALALARARQQAPAPPQAPPTKERTIFDFLAEHPGEVVVVGVGCRPPPVDYAWTESDPMPGWSGLGVNVGIPAGLVRWDWYRFDCHASSQEIMEFVRRAQQPATVSYTPAFALLPVYGSMMGGGAFCVGSS